MESQVFTHSCSTRKSESAPEKVALQIGARHFQISRNFRKDTSQSAKSEALVSGNCHVILGIANCGRQTKVTACLAGDPIPVSTEQLG